MPSWRPLAASLALAALLAFGSLPAQSGGSTTTSSSAPVAPIPAWPVLSVVAHADPDVGLDLQGSQYAAVGFMDANSNGREDAAAPDEPVDLDLDATHSVSYGDLRLTPFLRYPAGTAADITNRDVGRSLATLNGWFAVDNSESAAWYLDADASGTVTVGDIGFPGGSPQKVGAGDARLGHALAGFAGTKGALTWVDTRGDGSRPPLEPLYVHHDGGGSGRHVAVGDLRLSPQALAQDDDASRAELQAAVANVTLAPPTVVATTVSPVTASLPPAWRTLDWILVVVGVANLAGLVVVGRIAAARHPKNPFK